MMDCMVNPFLTNRTKQRQGSDPPVAVSLKPAPELVTYCPPGHKAAKYALITCPIQRLLKFINQARRAQYRSPQKHQFAVGGGGGLQIRLAAHFQIISDKTTTIQPCGGAVQNTGNGLTGLQRSGDFLQRLIQAGGLGAFLLAQVAIA